MRFLANENFPLPSTVLLRDNGQDIIDVADIMPSLLCRERKSKLYDAEHRSRHSQTEFGNEGFNKINDL
jgi:hypothetical protein